MYYFSATTQKNGGTGFYASELGTTPSDSIPVSDADFEKCMAAPHGSVWSFSTPKAGAEFGTLTLTEPAPPTDSAKLAAAQSSKINEINASYRAAVCADISFTTAAGTAQTFQADPGSQTVLMQSVSGFNQSGKVPSGFYWVASDNTQVPFTLEDLNGLYQAMLNRGWGAFKNRHDKRTAVREATTVSDVNAIVW